MFTAVNASKRAERDHFGGALPRNRQHRDVRNPADDPFVVNGIAAFRAQMAEHFFRKDFVAAHAIEKSRCADVSG